MTTTPHIVELHRVTRTFGSGRLRVTAVDDVSLSVAAGELVIVMGPSGSGKTTLLQLIGAMLTPTAGEVTIGGQALSGLDAAGLADIRLAQIGFVFQAFNLLAALPAVDNVALPARLAGHDTADARAAARHRLGQLGLDHRLDHLPEELSGGEKQRVALARALVNDPPLVLADEPTANLDAASGFQALHLLEQIAREDGKTVVIVTHDHRITDVADRLLWLAEGQLVDRPSAFDVAADPVCGMQIVTDRAAATRTVDGHVHHFCSQLCADRFDREPAAFLPTGRATR